MFSEPLIASEGEYSQSARTSAENSKREIFGLLLYLAGTLVVSRCKVAQSAETGGVFEDPRE